MWLPVRRSRKRHADADGSFEGKVETARKPVLEMAMVFNEARTSFW